MPIVHVNNIDLSYVENGTGEAIVFLHGYTGSTKDWEKQISFFSKNYRAIAIDHRGHGNTEAPSRKEDYAIKIFSQDVYALLNKLGVDRCCLVGHSMGGYMALQIILDHPDIVKALVLVDTASGQIERPKGFVELRAMLDELARKEGLRAAFEYEAANSPLRIERFAKHPEQREISLNKTLNTSVDGYIYVARSFGEWPPVTDRLGEIDVPTLIFWGEEDTPFLKASKIMNESISGSRLVKIPDVGHNPHEEVPDLFNQTLDGFLSEVRWR